jgi:hypothetical protein
LAAKAIELSTGRCFGPVTTITLLGTKPALNWSETKSDTAQCQYLEVAELHEKTERYKGSVQKAKQDLQTIQPCIKADEVKLGIIIEQ